MNAPVPKSRVSKGLIILVWLGLCHPAQSQEVPLTYDEFAFYFESAPLWLPEPLAQHFLEIPGGLGRPEVETLSLYRSETQAWEAYLYRSKTALRSTYHLATFSPQGTRLWETILPCPGITDGPVLLLWHGDSLLEMEYPTALGTGYQYAVIQPQGSARVLESNPQTTRRLPLAFLFNRLLTRAELAELSPEEAAYWRDYLLAVRNYCFPDRERRAHFAQELPRYRHRYFSRDQVPLTDLEQMNVHLLERYLDTGMLPEIPKS